MLLGPKMSPPLALLAKSPAPKSNIPNPQITVPRKGIVASPRMAIGGKRLEKKEEAQSREQRSCEQVDPDGNSETEVHWRHLPYFKGCR